MANTHCDLCNHPTQSLDKAFCESRETAAGYVREIFDALSVHVYHGFNMRLRMFEDENIHLTTKKLVEMLDEASAADGVTIRPKA